MKAIAMISGGLDSILAARIVKEQGIKVIPLNFKIPFCQRKKNFRPNQDLATFVRNNLGEELKEIDISEDFLNLLLEPKHGFGSQMNPCIDCKILMLKQAKKLFDSWQVQFVITGEVLGQRPMSQHRRALEAIEKESGLEGLLLRPLCARFLAETIPEKEGWVRRQELFNISGRSRRAQIALARSFNILDFPNAAGGCLLTDKQFSSRLQDLINHHSLNSRNIELLKIGRHFRLNPSAKLIVGRNEAENLELEKLARGEDYLFIPGEELAGPASLGMGEFNDELLQLSCAIATRYCDLNGEKTAKLVCYRKGPALSSFGSIDSSKGFPLALEAMPASEDKLESLRL